MWIRWIRIRNTGPHFPAGGKLGNFSTDFDLKDPKVNLNTQPASPLQILLQDASSPCQQTKQCNTSAHIFILYDKNK
jgi:hypothetical protein